MTGPAERLCTICARGGSKGVPGKNLRPLLGRPLIAHSVEQAKASGLFHSVAVSSDSDAILDAAADAGADVLIPRPDDLASDTAPKILAVQHAARFVEALHRVRYEVFVDLDATSPLRALDDIVAVVGLLETTDAPNVITAAPARRSPYFNLVELDEAGVPRLVRRDAGTFVRRQDPPECYDMNASVYAWRREALLDLGEIFLDKTQLYVMPRERSIDLDDDLDLAMIEWLATRAADSATPPSSEH